MQGFSSDYPYLPLWLLTLLFLGALLLARELGAYLRRRQRRRPAAALPTPAPPPAVGHTDEDDDDSFAMNSVLALLALLIGFTFSLALGRYDARRELVVKEANALGTTWLRTDLLDAPQRARMQSVLRRYVDARIDFGAARDAGEEATRYHRTETLQAELWAVMTAAIAPFRDTPRASLIVSTTNEAIDLAAERMATRQAHIPPRIQRMLLLFSLLAAGLVGYERDRQRRSTTLLLLLYALAISLVMDLDRPSTGMTNVPQTPMFDLRQSMR